jgi:DNA-binding NarL/FixJ family response regulator
MTADSSKSAPGAAAPPLASLASLGAALAERPYARRGVGQSAATIRIILVDDHTVVRQGLHALLRTAPDIVVVGEADSGPAAVKLAAQVAPDVVVMDLDMPGGDGATATRTLAATATPPKVLILTMHAEDEYLIELLQHGARGFLTKEAADRELVDAIRVVAAGDVYVRPTVARLLAARLNPARHRTPADEMREQFETLSDRERTVLRLIATGYNGPEIGEQLGITAKTVDTYKQRIHEKVGLAHRTDYVRFAATIGLLAEGGVR